MTNSDIYEPTPGAPTYFYTPDGAGIVFMADLLVNNKRDLWISDDALFFADFEPGNLSEWSTATP